MAPTTPLTAPGSLVGRGSKGTAGREHPAQHHRPAAAQVGRIVVYDSVTHRAHKPVSGHFLDGQPIPPPLGRHGFCRPV